MKTNLSKAKYCLACSAGIDSMVLLDLLVREGHEVIICHFNHLTRGIDNDKDYELIKEYASLHNLKVYYKEHDFTNETENFHDLAHKLRYDFFYQVCKKENCNLVLAHHATDLVETQILNYLRGSSIKGLAGFDYESNYLDIKIYRPLINYARSDIKKYQEEHQIKYNEDSSNAKDDYTRNRIRHHVVNELEKEANLVRRSLDYKDTLLEVDDLINSLIKDKDLLTMDLEEFNQLHSLLKKELIAKTLKTHNININKQIINSIITLLDNLEGNASLSLSNKYILRRSYNHLFLEKKDTLKKEMLIIEKEGYYEFQGKKLYISKIINNDYKLLCKICYNNRVSKLILRTRQNGDTLKMKYGTKKLKDFLIDKKVPSNLRDKLLIIEYNNEIYYVEDLFRLQKSGTNRVYIMEV